MTNTTTRIYNLIILDESGSMQSIKESIINGFNEIIQSIRHAAKEKPLEQFVSFYSFNGAGIKEQIPVSPVDQLKELTDKTYNPDTSTPLYDAIGHSCNKLKKAIKHVKDYKVLVTILTDGEENSSKEYKHEAVKALIQSLKKQGWYFTYIGTDHDVEKVAISLSISSSMAFKKNSFAVNNLMENEARLRGKFYDKIIKCEEVDESSYFDDKEKTKK